MDVVIVLVTNKKQREFPIAKPKTIIGRRQDCELRVPTRDVSRQHCEISLNGKAVTVRDLGSANGTYVNGKRVAEATLKAGDVLKVGPASFVVRINGRPSKIDASSVAGAAAAAGAASAAPIGEDELFELDETDFALDDQITALEDDEDMP